MDLSIIIVNYNVKEFIYNLLPSVKKAGEDIRYEVIVVDNASSDGSVEALRRDFPEVKLIPLEKNLGFSKANNIGLKEAAGEYLLLLNPDTLLSEDTLRVMLGFFRSHPDAGLAGCRILNPDGTLQLACRRSFPGPWVSFCKVTGLSALFPKSKLFAKYNLTYLNENETYEVDAVSGSFMMLPKKVYESIGGLDERFFMYGEDLDWCYRVQKAGYKVYYVHSTQIIHYKGESTKKSTINETEIFYDAMNLFVEKNIPGSWLVHLILRGAIIARKIVAFSWKKRMIIFPAIADAILYNLSLFTAEHIYSNFREWRGFPDFATDIVYTIPLALHLSTSALTGVYRKDSLSVLRNTGAVIISLVLLSFVTFFFRDFAYSRGVLLLSYAIIFTSLTLWRLIANRIIKGSEFSSVNKPVRSLIVGTDTIAVEIASKLSSKVTTLHTIAGFISSSMKDVGTELSGIKVIGTVETIKKNIAEHKIDEVIISSEYLSYNGMMALVADCQDENIEFKLAGKNLDFIVGKSIVSLIDDIPLIDLHYNISLPLNRFLKAIFDKLLASIILILIYPFAYLPLSRRRQLTAFGKIILEAPGVLTGKKSFVGPKNPGQFPGLYLGKEGVTGLWLIENSGDNNSAKLDIFYARNQNLWFDLEILGKSINKIIT